MSKQEYIEPDSQLIQSLAIDDMQAFRLLYEKYQPRLSRYLTSFCEMHASEDILQEVFVKLWQRRKLLVGITSIEYYLQRMARNRWLDTKRAEKIRHEYETSFATVSTRQALDVTDDIQYKEYHALANKAIRSLPNRRRKILELSLLYGRGLQEIATEMGLSREVVKKQLYLANRSIREYLQKHGDISLILILLLKMGK
ncbi:MAG: sigma-70 family RNA polymerase sigma factor [Chitinophagaceae bacterium]|nr:sigma-70 family RNA polymerase sigma factor [Chitinophagaceae bacterium]